MIQTWNHSRKGLITGVLVNETEDSDWVDIRLTTDHELKYASRAYVGRIDPEGEILRVRKSFLTEVTE